MTSRTTYYNQTYKMKIDMDNNFDWAEGMASAVTAADKDGVIRYMNRKARETYKKHGNLIGKSLYDCHGERAAAIIRRLLTEGGTNAYTIEKEGLRKMIYQTAVTAADGRVEGIVEVSMVIPDELPHYIRG